MSARTGPRAALVVFAAVSLWSAPVDVGAQGVPEALSIVGIVEIDATGRSEGLSTGFIVSPDGTVVTNSHAVFEAKEDPAHYQLLAIYEGPNGREFFGAEILCATSLRAIPDPGGNVPPERDAAMLRITAPPGPYRAWGFRLPGGQRYEWVRHSGPLPEFPALRIAGRRAEIGEHVRIPGYGRVSALPRIHVAEGRIEETLSARDGTPLLLVRYTNMTQPGNSGSPIMNERGEVVGLHTWHAKDADTGVGEDLSVVQHPCEPK